MRILLVKLLLLQIIFIGRISEDGLDNPCHGWVSYGDTRWDVTVDNAFIQNKLWPEIKRITGSSADFPKKIEYIFKPRDQKIFNSGGKPVFAFGIYFPLTAEIKIYVSNIFISELDFFRRKKLIRMDDRESNAYLLGNVAHELMHHAYKSEYNSSGAADHRRMKESGEFREVLEFIRNHGKSRGYAKALAFESINFALGHNCHTLP